MTFEERTSNVAGFGFTSRQARFLVMVMLHSGVCMARQYCAFAGTVRGQKVHNFFRRLLAREFATAFRCPRYGTRIYHLHHKPMYAAIGQGDNRNRRALTLAHALPRLMVLDAVLDARDLDWLGAEADKLTRFAAELQIDQSHLPSLRFAGADGSSTTRFFPDKLPIGRPHDGREHVFLFLARESFPGTFRVFLRRHAALLQRLPRWRVRLLLPRALSKTARLYRGAFMDECASPLRPAIVEELRWFFVATATSNSTSRKRDERYERAARAFAAPRFRSLYRAWQGEGDPVLDATVSHVLQSAVERSMGQLEICSLPHRYDHIYAPGDGPWF